MNKEPFLNAFKQVAKLFSSDSWQFGKYRSLSIKVSKFGDMASSMYEIPYEFKNKQQHFSGLYRLSVIYQKEKIDEKKEWKIVQWFASNLVDR